jgi:membrane-bound metal-dependent hydrolase YbcI (DUF457 family)
MFIGHYGVAFAAKPVRQRLPLWLLFIAVQWLDVVWSVLVMLGVERMRIVKGFTEANSMDLYYMPYTHGLIGALALSAAFGGVTLLFLRDRKAASFVVIAGAVFSHWLLDLVVHVRDLPLLGDSMKVGFGLWRHVWLSLPLELATLYAGAAVYARYAPSNSRLGDIVLWVFVAALTLAQLYGQFGPDPASPLGQAQMALFAYLALAAVAFLVDVARGTEGRRRDKPVTKYKSLERQPIST